MAPLRFPGVDKRHNVKNRHAPVAVKIGIVATHGRVALAPLRRGTQTRARVRHFKNGQKHETQSLTLATRVDMSLALMALSRSKSAFLLQSTGAPPVPAEDEHANARQMRKTQERNLTHP